jgi:hypothetical protein
VNVEPGATAVPRGWQRHPHAGACIALVIGLAVSGLLIGREVHAAGDRTGGGLGLPVFSAPVTPAERVVAYMDGERYAQLATDPLLAHPSVDFNGNLEQAAYIGARPLLSWAAWLLSVGGRLDLAWAMLVLTWMTAGALVVATAARAIARRRDPLWAWAVVLLPGAIAVLTSPGEGDLLATALAVGGLVLWQGGTRRSLAVVLLSLAAVTRETTLLVPAAIALHILVRDRRIEWRLVCPLAAYIGWVAFVLARTGYLPSDSGAGTMAVPLSFVRDSVPYWGPPEVLSIVVFLALAVAVWGRLDVESRLVLLGSVGLFALLAQPAAAFWWAFARILLPAYVLLAVELAPRVNLDPGPVGGSPRRSRGGGRVTFGR